MNKDQIAGRVDQTAGKAKVLAGKVLGNDRLRAEGMVEQAKGKVKSTVGDAKEHAKDQAKKVIDKL